jgi:UDP-N-acetylglucosamine 1-carboxyvinyltransferase
MTMCGVSERLLVWGEQRLEGEIEISGAKNASLPILAASLLGCGKTVVGNVPQLADVDVMRRLMQFCGAIVMQEGHTVSVQIGELAGDPLCKCKLASEIRYSIHLFTALLLRLGRIQMPLPGGCSIGSRKLDSYVLGLSRLGAKVELTDDGMIGHIRSLHGANIVLEYPSVSATENVLMSCCLAKGVSTIRNVAKEPEVVDLANYLRSMGAEIAGAGTDIIKVRGVRELDGACHTVIPDRVETGTYMVAGAITDGDILLKNTRSDLLQAVTSALSSIGVSVEEERGGMRVRSSGHLHPVRIVTDVYPGFPTDMQPIVTTLLTKANGRSEIKETIFERRFGHVPELVRMGADVRVSGNGVLVEGPTKLTGSRVKARDIRSGGALLVAGLAAEGLTVIEDANQIARGYEDPVKKLIGVGAECELTSPSSH